jgi:hypothetical protein
MAHDEAKKNRRRYMITERRCARTEGLNRLRHGGFVVRWDVNHLLRIGNDAEADVGSLPLSQL